MILGAHTEMLQKKEVWTSAHDSLEIRPLSRFLQMIVHTRHFEHFG